jgi:cysteine desulfurase
MRFPIYLDNHATTRTDPRVVEAMLPYFTEKYGNAASTNHIFGEEANAAVKTARQQVADLLGAQAREIIFTSGATESNNLALKGAVHALRAKGNHLITNVIEHKAVLDVCARLQQEGCTVTYLPVDEFGRVSVEQLAAAITERTILVSVMAANNEIGTLQPLQEIGQLCKSRGVLFHSDATQAVGKVPLDVEALGMDLLSLSAHKFYGPKGVGALYVRRSQPRVRLEPLVEGGGQEHGIRSGTLATPLIVGLGAACAIAQQEMPSESQRLLALREHLHQGILTQVPEVMLNGHPTLRLPGNLNLSFAYVQGEALLLAMKDIAVSSGSACTTMTNEASYVLRAIGRSEELADASLRFGLGRFNTTEEIDWVIGHVARTVARLRTMSAAWQDRTAVARPAP